MKKNIFKIFKIYYELILNENVFTTITHYEIIRGGGTDERLIEEENFYEEIGY